MEIEHDKFVFLDRIPEMRDAQRTWLKEQCGAGKGYYESETGNFIIVIPAWGGAEKYYRGHGMNTATWSKIE